MRHIFLLILFVLPVMSHAQVIEPIKITYQGEEYWMVGDYEDTLHLEFPPFWTRPAYIVGASNGKFISFYKDDISKVSMIYQVKDNHLEGQTLVFRFNGTKAWEYNFHLNEQDGFQRYWDKNGTLLEEHIYALKGDRIFSINVGEWRDWYDTGTIHTIEHYDNEGERHGNQVEYYVDGQMKTEAFFIHGEMDSTYTRWHPNGIVKSRIRFVTDTVCYIEYHSNGSIAGTGNIVKGEKIGHWVYYYDNGQKKSEGEYGPGYYENDCGLKGPYMAKVCKWKYWYPSGALLVEGEIEDVWRFEPGFCVPYAVGGGYKDIWKYYNEEGDEIDCSMINSQIFLEDDWSELPEDIFSND